MRFSFHGARDKPTLAWFADGLRDALETRGHVFVEAADDARLVINFFPEGSPRWFRRNGQAVFVTGVTHVEGSFEQPLARGYPLLVKSLSNLLVALVGEGRAAETHFLTPEQGHYVVHNGGPNGQAGFFAQVYERLAPLASSTLVARPSCMRRIRPFKNSAMRRIPHSGAVRHSRPVAKPSGR